MNIFRKEKNAPESPSESVKKGWFKKLQERIYPAASPDDIPGENELAGHFRERCELEFESLCAADKKIQAALADWSAGEEKNRLLEEARSIRREAKQALAHLESALPSGTHPLKDHFHVAANFAGMEVSCTRKGSSYVLEIPDSSEKFLELPDIRLAKATFAKACEVLEWKSWPDHAYNEAKAILDSDKNISEI